MVICISREFGAGGRTVAKALSEKLGIPYYDTDFLRETAREMGYDLSEIEKLSEELSPAEKFFNGLLGSVASYNSHHDSIFKVQKEVILKLSEKPCIIVGRCADHILRSEGRSSFNIFLYTDLAHKMEYARKHIKEECSEEELEKIVQKTNNNRKNYYKHYTGTEMGNYSNHHISLDTGEIGMQKCIDILLEILESKGE